MQRQGKIISTAPQDADIYSTKQNKSTKPTTKHESSFERGRVLQLDNVFEQHNQTSWLNLTEPHYR
jgi:hypothetical protein